MNIYDPLSATKQCCIVATTVNGEKFKENIDVSWIHMRTSLWEEA